MKARVMRPIYWWAVVSPNGTMRSLNKSKKMAIDHACWITGRFIPLETVLARGNRVVRVTITEKLS